jgi:hypothetical protein
VQGRDDVVLMGRAPVGLLEDGWNSLGRHDNDAVGVADDEVTSADGTPPSRIGTPSSPTTSLRVPRMLS